VSGSAEQAKRYTEGAAQTGGATRPAECIHHGSTSLSSRVWVRLRRPETNVLFAPIVLGQVGALVDQVGGGIVLAMGLAYFTSRN